MTAASVGASPVDSDAFRSLMGTVCKQVTVVTTRGAHGEPMGTTVSAFSSLSLRPPMVSIALDRGSRLLAQARHTRRIGINLLGEGQETLAAHFASKADDKFTGQRWEMRDTLPALLDTPGWIATEVVELVEGGDHIVLFCQVTAATAATRRPLVYSHRQFGTNSALLTAT